MCSASVQVPVSVFDNHSLSPSSKVTYCCLKILSGSKNECQINISDIASKVGVSRCTVLRSLGELEIARLIGRKRLFHGSTIYKIL